MPISVYTVIPLCIAVLGLIIYIIGLIDLNGHSILGLFIFEIGLAFVMKALMKNKIIPDTFWSWLILGGTCIALMLIRVAVQDGPID